MSQVLEARYVGKEPVRPSLARDLVWLTARIAVYCFFFILCPFYFVLSMLAQAGVITR